ncbi:MAG: hypothetical protein DI551_00665 [Micavibrio aeruginosavorus]|uniref:HTH cro/C1-type domain-containing protein n=1 Tax=Micavibrio aeruginosavorus TaxID=349221 RepID=A0A2W5NDU4_9BACT|nr:MAG: hypothetical protein DI551_00665 [Micavibrio aeruginosavorus]
MTNLYRNGTLVSMKKCTNADIHPIPFWNNTFGMKNYLRELRKTRELTQEQLAELVGTTHATVQRHENAKRRLTQEWLAKYSNALGCHISDITDGPGQSAPINAQEKALLQLMRQMEEPDQIRFIHMAEAFLTPEKTDRKEKK